MHTISPDNRQLPGDNIDPWFLQMRNTLRECHHSELESLEDDIDDAMMTHRPEMGVTPICKVDVSMESE